MGWAEGRGNWISLSFCPLVVPGGGGGERQLQCPPPADEDASVLCGVASGVPCVSTCPAQQMGLGPENTAEFSTDQSCAIQ